MVVELVVSDLGVIDEVVVPVGRCQDNLLSNLNRLLIEAKPPQCCIHIESPYNHKGNEKNRVH